MSTELTGRRRFIYDEEGYGVLALQVEKSSFVDGAWENNWYWAKPEDVSGETIVGLPDRAG